MMVESSTDHNGTPVSAGTDRIEYINFLQTSERMSESPKHCLAKKSLKIISDTAL